MKLPPGVGRPTGIGGRPKLPPAVSAASSAPRLRRAHAAERARPAMAQASRWRSKACTGGVQKPASRMTVSPRRWTTVRPPPSRRTASSADVMPHGRPDRGRRSTAFGGREAAAETAALPEKLRGRPTRAVGQAGMREYGQDKRSKAGMRSPPGPLRSRNFQLLVACDVVTLAGTSIASVAIPFAVLSIHGSGSDVGFVPTAGLLPLVLFLLLGGVVADRLPRHQVMIAADLLQGAAQTAAAVVMLTGTAHVWGVL